MMVTYFLSMGALVVNLVVIPPVLPASLGSVYNASANNLWMLLVRVFPNYFNAKQDVLYAILKHAWSAILKNGP